ncbi:MAG: glycosyltransferase, partial [Alphaproteobacteria bacterium]|nr:glycosyltransferase [Alphaproteobacteria bacterium]
MVETFNQGGEFGAGRHLAFSSDHSITPRNARGIECRPSGENRLEMPGDILDVERLLCVRPARRPHARAQSLARQQPVRGAEPPGLVARRHDDAGAGFQEKTRRLALPNAELVLAGRIIGSGRGLRPYRDLFRHIPHVPHGEVHALYQDADLFVFPSLHEGSAFANLEAMASGLPVITTLRAGSIVRDGEDGYIVPIRNVDALMARIERLYRDKALRDAMGTSARARRGVRLEPAPPRTGRLASPLRCGDALAQGLAEVLDGPPKAIFEANFGRPTQFALGHRNVRAALPGVVLRQRLEDELRTRLRKA